jgi:hypothetical protein
MSRLTDTQLIILSAASQRDDRGVDLPARPKSQNNCTGRRGVAIALPSDLSTPTPPRLREPGVHP